MAAAVRRGANQVNNYLFHYFFIAGFTIRLNEPNIIINGRAYRQGQNRSNPDDNDELPNNAYHRERRFY